MARASAYNQKDSVYNKIYMNYMYRNKGERFPDSSCQMIELL